MWVFEYFCNLILDAMIRKKMKDFIQITDKR